MTRFRLGSTLFQERLICTSRWLFTLRVGMSEQNWLENQNGSRGKTLVPCQHQMRKIEKQKGAKTGQWVAENWEEWAGVWLWYPVGTSPLTCVPILKLCTNSSPPRKHNLLNFPCSSLHTLDSIWRDEKGALHCRTLSTSGQVIWNQTLCLTGLASILASPSQLEASNFAFGGGLPLSSRQLATHGTHSHPWCFVSISPLAPSPCPLHLSPCPHSSEFQESGLWSVPHGGSQVRGLYVLVTLELQGRATQYWV